MKKEEVPEVQIKKEIKSEIVSESKIPKSPKTEKPKSVPLPPQVKPKVSFVSHDESSNYFQVEPKKEPVESPTQLFSSSDSELEGKLDTSSLDSHSSTLCSKSGSNSQSSQKEKPGTNLQNTHNHL